MDRADGERTEQLGTIPSLLVIFDICVSLEKWAWCILLPLEGDVHKECSDFAGLCFETVLLLVRTTTDLGITTVHFLQVKVIKMMPFRRHF